MQEMQCVVVLTIYSYNINATVVFMHVIQCIFYCCCFQILLIVGINNLHCFFRMRLMLEHFFVRIYHAIPVILQIYQNDIYLLTKKKRCGKREKQM